MEGKTKFREVRTVSASDIRKLCIRNNWYTRGDNDQYEHLQNDLCEQNVNDELFCAAMIISEILLSNIESIEQARK